jgi:Tfp pilus assembly protein PilF
MPFIYEHNTDVKAPFSYQPGRDDGCQPKRRFRMIWMRSTAGILCMGIALALAAARDNTALEEGVARFQRGDFAGAAQALGRAARERPSDARVQTYLGMAYAAQGDYKSAEDPLRRACALNPAEDNACYFLGRTLYNLSRFEEALDAFETALRHASRPGRTRNGMALAWEALGRVRDAELCYQEAMRQGETRAQVDYGMFLYKMGRTAESVAVLRKAHAEPELARVMEAMAHQPALHAGAFKPSPVNFQESTLPMVLKNGATGSKYLPETMTGGVAIFDYNNDGWPDIYVVNGATLPSGKKTDPSFWNRLFRNNGDGTFTDVTEAAGVAGHGYAMGVAAGDFDNDGFVDLFVAGVGSNTLFRNKGDGTFEDVTDRAGLGGNHGWSVSAGWFDYDRDGRLDLFVVRYVVWDPSTEIYCGERKPGYRSYCHPTISRCRTCCITIRAMAHSGTSRANRGSRPTRARGWAWLSEITTETGFRMCLCPTSAPRACHGPAGARACLTSTTTDSKTSSRPTAT